MKSWKVFIVTVLILAAGNVSAQFLGQMSSADVVDLNTGKAGGYVVLADGATAVVGSVRYGFSEYIEGRGRFGFIDPDGGDMSIIFGADFKYQLWGYNQPDYPFDLALGGFLEYADLSHSSLLGVGGSVIGSLPLAMKNNHSIEPYARFNLRMQRVSVDDFTVTTGLGTETVKGGSDSELKLGLNVGAVFSVIDLVDFTAEIQIDDDTAFLLGIDILAF
ncbi:MAG: hypothetical protein GY841_11385 [FCB group bacterium]|nr:hypothetical protein [FCB group bacterium]